jgi:ribonuclease PH
LKCPMRCLYDILYHKIFLSMVTQEPHFREILATFGRLENNDASAVVRFGKTEVACGLFGPVESRTGRDTFAGLIVDVSTRSCVAIPTHYHKHIDSVVSDIVMQCVDTVRFPFMQLNISIEVVSDDGSLLSVLGNAVCLALLHSGLPLVRRVVSFSVAFATESMRVDPDKLTETTALSQTTLFMPTDSNEPIYVIHEGDRVTQAQYDNLMKSTQAICDALYVKLMSGSKDLAPSLRFTR